MIITFIAGVGGTGFGGLLSACFKQNSKKTVSLLLSFAGGIMLAVVCFDLIPEAIGDRVASPLNLLYVTLGVVFGFAIVAMLNYLIDRSTNHEISHIDEEHPKTADDLDELIHSNHLLAHEAQNSHLFVAGIIMAAAIALHNLPEGMVIGTSYVGQTASVLSGSGIVMAIVIALHNIPEGMAVAVPLMAGGMPKGRAVLITATTGFPTVIGALIGYLVGSLGEIWHVLSLGFASGAMLYVVFGELLPESILMWRSKLPALAMLAGILGGMALIFA
ncbi:MAG: ZIP family metal transporter [Oscillospiraceae bacterium]